MKKVFLLCLLFAVFLLNACQTTPIDSPIITNAKSLREIPTRTIPVDVISEYIAPQAITPQAVNVTQGNLFDNGSFESGLVGWTGCETGALSESSNAYEGSKALKVNSGNCFYRSTEVSVGQELILSCYVRLESGNGWTGMGLGFADSSWTTIDNAPTTIITGNTYQRYDVKATAPVGSKYASMWLYSDNPAVVDNCSLMLEQEPPPPPPSSGNNLLENPKFNPGLLNWSLGCASSVDGIGTIGISLKNGTCLDQSLSSSDIATLRGQEFTFSCAVQNTGGYAAMTIFLDGQPSSVVIPNRTSSGTEVVKIQGTVGNNISSGFVSIYAEGESLFIGACSLIVDTGEPPLPLGDNLLENNNFEQLAIWNIGCSGSVNRIAGRRVDQGSRSSLGYNLQNGACVDQTLSSEDLAQLAGKNYKYSCYTKNESGYASLSIFFDGIPVSTVVPTSSDFELVEITGVAPSVGSGFVSIYADGNLVVDDCSLRITE